VTDFIAVSSFPVFNLADVSITLGFIVLMVVALRGEQLLGR
jgi:lipoprotein signal peptidase